jgi:hypothetical protein
MISLNSLRNFVTIAALASSTIHAAEPESLHRTLEPYLKEFGLPALAAAVRRSRNAEAHEVPLQSCTGPLRHFAHPVAQTTRAVRVISVSRRELP